MSSDRDVAGLAREGARFAARGNAQRALSYYASALQADPDQLAVRAQAAALLLELGGADAKVGKLLKATAIALGDDGQLPLALAVTKSLLALDEGLGRGALGALASAYCRDSARIQAKPSGPPPRKRARAARANEPAADEALASVVDRARTALLEASWGEQSAGGHGGALNPARLLSSLSERAFVGLVTGAELQKRAQGDTILREGETGDSFYLICEGQVEVSRADRGTKLALARLGPGTFFGEMAIVARSKRSATVAADGPVTLLAISRELVDRLSRADPQLAVELAKYTRRRILENLMVTSPLFTQFEPADRAQLVVAFAATVYQVGDFVVKAGADAPGLYVVANGRCEVTREQEGETLILAKLAAGAIFGEISLLRATTTTADVVAVSENTVVLYLSKASFDRVVEKYPKILSFIYKLASEREQATSEALAPRAIPVDESLIMV